MTYSIKRSFLAAAFFALAVMASNTGFAAERAVTLSVPSMNCAACPFIVKQSLIGVDVVAAVKVSFEAKTAVVTFDDTKTTVAALQKATTDRGYPSTVSK